MSTVKLEFVVRMTCGGCEDAVKTALNGQEGVKSVFTDHASERVIVETTLNSSHIQKLIETTGRRAILQGLGSGKGESMRGLGAAVSMMSGAGAQGVTRLIQADNDTCIIEGTLDGLQPGKHRLQIHQFGDLSEGCHSCGDVFNPGFIKGTTKVYGDLGTVDVQPDGRTDFRLQNRAVKVSDIIGRSMIIHNLAKQQQTGDGSRVACGIIARSSGLFENSKRICACDGITIWDEREVPAAGAQRGQHQSKSSPHQSSPQQNTESSRL